MILELKVRKAGNSLGLVLPKEVLQHLHVAEGDTLFLTGMSAGAIRISAWDPDFARQVKVAEAIRREYRNVFKELGAL